MKKVKDDLWETVQESPFPGMYTHAYLLECPEGNVLIYNTSNQDDLEKIKDIGGINIQYLSHRDEVGPSLNLIKETFSSQLASHELERIFAEKYSSVDVIIKEETTDQYGIRIIPSPGHTNGSISFLYDSPNGLRYLFTGDTVFHANNQWNSLIFPGHDGDKNSLISTLKNYISLEPNIVISSGSSEPITITEVTVSEWTIGMNNLIQRL